MTCACVFDNKHLPTVLQAHIGCHTFMLIIKKG